jgi:hypothetical protein
MQHATCAGGIIGDVGAVMGSFSRHLPAQPLSARGSRGKKTLLSLALVRRL